MTGLNEQEKINSLLQRKLENLERKLEKFDRATGKYPPKDLQDESFEINLENGTQNLELDESFTVNVEVEHKGNSGARLSREQQLAADAIQDNNVFI